MQGQQGSSHGGVKGGRLGAAVFGMKAPGERRITRRTSHFISEDGDELGLIASPLGTWNKLLIQTSAFTFIYIYIYIYNKLTYCIYS